MLSTKTSFFLALSIEIFLAESLFAETFTGYGYAKTINESKRQALSELSTALSVDVESEIFSCIKKGEKNNDCGSRSSVRTYSNLPIVGADFEIHKEKDGDFKAIATLSTKKSLPFYIRETNDIRKRINSRKNHIQQAEEDTSLFKMVKSQKDDLIRFNKLRLVAISLGAKNIGEELYGASKLDDILLNIKEGADTLTAAAEVISSGINQNDIFIMPARLRNTSEVTPFARVLSDHLDEKLNSVKNPLKASYYLTGEYNILDNDDVHIIITLSDDFNNAVLNRTVKIKKEAYIGLRAKPVSSEVELLVEENAINDQDFYVDITSHAGRENLFFKKGEVVSIYVKLSEPGWFYVIGHIVRKEEQYSYLLELSESSGADRFLIYISDELVGRYVEIGEFQITEPFGVEYLQLVASNKSLRKSIPDYIYDNGTGFFIINGSKGSVSTTLLKTRGLKKIHKSRAKRTKIAENTLVFSTLKN